MFTELTARVIFLCDAMPGIISKIPEETMAVKPAPDKWSKKEIMGHLVDSAANNHQRFIRGQFEHEPVIFYDQNNWVNLQHYNEAPIQQILGLWQAYNRHLAYVISTIPEENLNRQCRGKDGKLYTLKYLVEDYLVHMEHHLKQVGDY